VFILIFSFLKAIYKYIDSEHDSHTRDERCQMMRDKRFDLYMDHIEEMIQSSSLMEDEIKLIVYRKMRINPEIIVEWECEYLEEEETMVRVDTLSKKHRDSINELFCPEENVKREKANYSDIDVSRVVSYTDEKLQEFEKNYDKITKTEPVEEGKESSKPPRDPQEYNYEAQKQLIRIRDEIYVKFDFTTLDQELIFEKANKMLTQIEKDEVLKKVEEEEDKNKEEESKVTE
jgi:hypothetical protein